MKILMTTTMVLGAICVLAMNEPVFARGGGHGGGGHGGGHGGGGHGGGHYGGGHGGGYAHGGGGHHGHGYGHGYGYGGGWGYGAAGLGLGLGAGILGTTIYNDSYGTYAPAYQQDVYVDPYAGSNCYQVASGAVYCN